jgi:hypothetical protein
LGSRWRPYPSSEMEENESWEAGGSATLIPGVGDMASRLVFSQVDAGQLGGARIVMAACGWYHSVVASAEGRVRTFGYGTFGILSHRLVPMPVASALFGRARSWQGPQGASTPGRG